MRKKRSSSCGPYALGMFQLLAIVRMPTTIPRIQKSATFPSQPGPSTTFWQTLRLCFADFLIVFNTSPSARRGHPSPDLHFHMSLRSGDMPPLVTETFSMNFLSPSIFSRATLFQSARNHIFQLDCRHLSDDFVKSFKELIKLSQVPCGAACARNTFASRSACCLV